MGCNCLNTTIFLSYTVLVNNSSLAYLRWQAGLPEALGIIHDKHDASRAGLSPWTNIKLPGMAYLQAGPSVTDSLLFIWLQISRRITRSNFLQSCSPSERRSSKKIQDLKKCRPPHSLLIRLSNNLILVQKEWPPVVFAKPAAMSLSSAMSVKVKAASISVQHADHVTVRRVPAHSALELALFGLGLHVDIAIMG